MAMVPAALISPTTWFLLNTHVYPGRIRQERRSFNPEISCDRRVDNRGWPIVEQHQGDYHCVLWASALGVPVQNILSRLVGVGGLESSAR